MINNNVSFKEGMTLYKISYHTGVNFAPTIYHNVVLSTHTAWGELRDNPLLRCGSQTLNPWEVYASEAEAKVAWLKSFKKALPRINKRIAKLRAEADALEKWTTEVQSGNRN